MSDASFEYQIEPEEWPKHLTDKLRRRFERVGFEGVQWDVVNHNYGTPEKHYAALHWLGLKRRRQQRITYMILAVAIATLVVSAWPRVRQEGGLVNEPIIATEEIEQSGSLLEQTPAEEARARLGIEDEQASLIEAEIDRLEAEALARESARNTAIDECLRKSLATDPMFIIEDAHVKDCEIEYFKSTHPKWNDPESLDGRIYQILRARNSR
jgi:hypothetical protein